MKPGLTMRVLVACLLALPCAAQEAPPSATALLAFTGVYTAEHRDMVVSLQRAPGIVALLLTDLQTDEVRLLMPVSSDEFAGGHELARPHPEAFRLRFRRSPGGAVTALSLVRGQDTLVAAKRALSEAPVKWERDGLRFHGTIYLPERVSGRSAAAVMAHGSEDSDRYSFGALPYVLARRGLVVLSYDKRGTGETTGDWSSAGLEELADDLRVAIGELAARRDVDPARVGVVGLSEGGWVAPLASARGARIAYIIALSGGGLTKGLAFIHKDSLRLAERGLVGSALDSALAPSRRLVAESALRVGSGGAATGFDRRVTFDPTAAWSAFRGPILSVGGEADVLEDAPASARRLQALLDSTGHRDHVIKVFPRAHHGAFFLGRERRPSEWAGLRGITQVVPGFWDLLIRWIEVRYGRVAP